MDNPAALHRIKVGVPATVEHSSDAGPETGKWVAETTQVRMVPVSFNPLRVTPTAYTELHHVHGCVTTSYAGKGPVAPDLAGSHDKLCSIQGKQRLGRSQQNGFLVRLLIPYGSLSLT